MFTPCVVRVGLRRYPHKGSFLNIFNSVTSLVKIQKTEITYLKFFPKVRRLLIYVFVDTASATANRL